MRLVTSNRLEGLLSALAETLEVPLASPLAAEQVVVPAGGMSRWLTQALARRFGVCAGVEMRSVEGFAAWAVAQVDGLGPDAVFGSPTSLAWRIAETLPPLLAEPEFEAVARYLEMGQPDALHQLSEQMAVTFHRYLHQRPAWVCAWDAGERAPMRGEAATHEAWQRLLWQALVGAEPTHLAARLPAFVQACESRRVDAATLPERLLVFAPHSIGPLHLDVLTALAHVLPTHVFALSPAPNEARHPLTESIEGRSATRRRSFAQRARSTETRFVSRTAYSALTSLTCDVFEGQRSPFADFAQVTDGSLEVHVCHTPLREVEVLHDRLVDAFDRDESLKAEDVLVRVTDMATYAPLIESVFGHRTPGEPRIPYGVGGAPTAGSDELTEALLAALQLLHGRFEAPEVVDLLSRDVVRARLDLSPVELDRVRDWLLDAGAAWAVDAADRARLGVPAFSENTLRFALDRLLLGAAMDSSGGRLFGGLLPVDDVEGGITRALGSASAFLGTLAQYRRESRRSRSVSEWQAYLVELSALVGRGTRSQHAALRRALKAWSRAAETAGQSAPIPFATVVRQLPNALRQGAGLARMLSGGVSFLPLGAALGVPARITAVLGVDDDFPRRDSQFGFDLLAAAPEPNDPSARDEDRSAFLWALLATEERLLLSYVGRDARTNKMLPPSVVLAELLDEVDAKAAMSLAANAESHALAQPSSVRQAFTLVHPLMPFSPRYFLPEATEERAAPSPRLFSYAKHYLPTALALSHREPRAHAFFDRGRTAPAAPSASAQREQLDVDDLIRTLRSPTAAFLRRALELTMPEEDPRLPWREPLEVGGLEQWKLMMHIIGARLEGRDESSVRAEVSASGGVPLGLPGRFYLDEKRGLLHDYVCMTRECRGGELLPPQPIRVRLEDVDIVGDLRRVSRRRDGSLSHGDFSYSADKGRNLLPHWVRHLVYCATHGAARSWLVSNSGGETPSLGHFEPVDDPKAELASLVEVYHWACRASLPLFPHTSPQWMVATQAKEDEEPQTPEEALASGRDMFEARRFGRKPEAEEWENFIVWGNDDPFRLDFEAIPGVPETNFCDLTERVYLPVIEHYRAEKVS